MRRLVSAGFFVALVLFPLFGYTFLRGAEWGANRYRHSNAFMLAMYSMYMLGLKDGCTSDATCDKAGLSGGDDGGPR